MKVLAAFFVGLLFAVPALLDRPPARTITRTHTVTRTVTVTVPTTMPTVVTTPVGLCPQEDSCAADYHGGQWHIAPHAH